MSNLTVDGSENFRVGDVMRTRFGDEIVVTAAAAGSWKCGWDADTHEPYVERDGVRQEGPAVKEALETMREVVGPYFFDIAMAQARVESGGDE